jgi:hypothetical protein
MGRIAFCPLQLPVSRRPAPERPCGRLSSAHWRGWRRRVAVRCFERTAGAQRMDQPVRRDWRFWWCLPSQRLLRSRARRRRGSGSNVRVRSGQRVQDPIRPVKRRRIMLESTPPRIRWAQIHQGDEMLRGEAVETCSSFPMDAAQIQAEKCGDALGRSPQVLRPRAFRPRAAARSNHGRRERSRAGRTLRRWAGPARTA